VDSYKLSHTPTATLSSLITSVSFACCTAAPSAETPVHCDPRGYIYWRHDSGDKSIYTIRLKTAWYSCIHVPNEETVLVDAQDRTVCSSQDRRKRWERWIGTIGNASFQDADGVNRGDLQIHSMFGQFVYRVDNREERLSMRSQLLRTRFESEGLRIDQRLTIWCGEPLAEFQFSRTMDPHITCAIIGHLIASCDAKQRGKG
jgi:hypothetical protein